MKNIKLKKSFTLIELLIVVAIIGVLTGLVIVVINPEQLRREARDANRKKDLSIISAALEQYYADNNAYPVNDGSDTTNSTVCMRENLTADDSISGASDDCGDLTGAPTYIREVPVTQTTTSTEYCYDSWSSNQNYILCAPLEADSTENYAVPSGSDDCTKADIGLPVGFASVDDVGLYCIENPF